MEKHHEKQLHPNEIDSDSTAYESINNSTDAQSTALSPDESTEFVNSMQISQAVKQENNNIHELTDSADSSIPAGETLPLPTAEEVNQALLNSDKTVSHSEDTKVFSPSEDSHITEPINSYDALDNSNEPNSSQFNQQTETLPIFNQSSPEINSNVPSGKGRTIAGTNTPYSFMLSAVSVIRTSSITRKGCFLKGRSNDRGISRTLSFFASQ